MLATRDDAKHSRLTGTVDADEGDVLALGNLKADIREDFLSAVRLGKLMDRHDRGRSHNEENLDVMCRASLSGI
jgi:hypothetical protein